MKFPETEEEYLEMRKEIQRGYDNKDETITCVICFYPIEDNGFGWKGGHNAMPFAQGRCCDSCHNTHVLPTRIANALEQSYLARSRDVVDQLRMRVNLVTSSGNPDVDLGLGFGFQLNGSAQAVEDNLKLHLREQARIIALGLVRERNQSKQDTGGEEE
jgi:hypothetical protein